MSTRPLNFRRLRTPEDRRRFILTPFFGNSRRIKLANQIHKYLKTNILQIQNVYQSLNGRSEFSGDPLGFSCRTCSSPFCASNNRLASCGVIVSEVFAACSPFFAPDSPSDPLDEACADCCFCDCWFD